MSAIDRSMKLPALSMILLSMLSLTGCPNDGIERMVYQGQFWKYGTFVPPQHDGVTPLPLVIALHGFADEVLDFQGDIGLDKVAEREGFFVAYPQARQGAWRFGIFIPATTSDSGFVNALIDRFMSQYAIDPDRIYVTGLSQGGLLAQQIACELSHRIAAVAPVGSAAIPELMAPQCRPANPPAFLGIHGTDDRTIPFDGQESGLVGAIPRVEIRSVDETLEFWRQLHGCDEFPTLTTLPDIDPDDRTSVRYTEYQGCDGAVALYTIFGGGHTWPGSDRPVGNGVISREINAGEVMWEFFEANPLR